MLIPRGERVLMVKVKELIEGPMMLVVLGTRRIILAMDLDDILGETILPWNQLMVRILAIPLVYLSMNTSNGSSHFIVNH